LHLEPQSALQSESFLQQQPDEHFSFPWSPEFEWDGTPEERPGLSTLALNNQPWSGPLEENAVRWVVPESAPKPPAWHRFEQRAHLLELELDDLEIKPNTVDLKAAWYESVTFFLTFHPHSEDLQALPLPREAPRSSIEGEVLVSRTVAAKAPEVRVPEATQESVAIFSEKLSLKKDYLDHHLVIYLWGRKASLTGEEILLLGWHVLPLRDYSLQRHSKVWGLFDVSTALHVADMRMTYAVSTTPGHIQNPHKVDATQTDVTIRWTPPKNDHGAPVIGHKIALHVNDKAVEPLWITLCECTKTANPVYVIPNLTGNTSYCVAIQAINKVGLGDACEFAIRSAPLNPNPPPKPWIQQALDGCLCVAWTAPDSDGGSPILVYKVRMWKALGGSAWNLFGPTALQGTWTEMGTVSARHFDDGDEIPEYDVSAPTDYTAWVGPLEDESCEYSFQIVAVSAVGRSDGSPLSDPFTT